ncbi:primosomal protein N' [Paenalkalicoccus suaedae]|uniref:Replication restart protein PriA n=1 Tax=Paenalkalicoccus suaedae TaxID=2592382 RepID=A0A859FH03_9BACI|nr:primosomal protein N' [Paenalkalicoccus suaedae]QKS71486.1 primosomal protein N' [Paenalkalicoccus suaedae]
MIASVIVDVAARQTDRMFDYLVPNELADTIVPGVRVHVPFANRNVQGFVMKLHNEPQIAIEKLKPISDQLDLTPPVTEELLLLSEAIKEETLSYHISVLKAMLPAAMRASYDKELYLEEEDPELTGLFVDGVIASWNEFTKQAPENDIQLITRHIRKGTIRVSPIVTTKDARKKQLQVTYVQEPDLTQFSQAKKQLLLSEYLLTCEIGTSFTLKGLAEEANVTTAVINQLVDKGVLKKDYATVGRDPYAGRTFKSSVPMALTEEQQESIRPIEEAFQTNKHETFLLHGVTGSGKTEIYLQSIEQVLDKGKEAIVLVPEISLTPQMVTRFKSRFGSRVAVLHSALSKGEKYDEWRKIREGKVDVVVGARSAVFAPFTNLGIIIIDEEHEMSYKQEEAPRYHARDVAIKRASYYNCPVILGSATPSLESFARAKKGVYTLLSMQERVNQTAMPPVHVIDMREELQNGNRSMFSTSVLEAMQDRLAKKEQMVLLLNRRGYSTFIMCRDCGYVAECPHCDISLTYHRNDQSLQCHYCGHRETIPTVCPSCQSDSIRFFGTGTQKVEQELAKELPDARVIRMDVDTTRRKGSHEKLLQSFEKGEADILLGTQMIAKGLDFPNITLVGVLAADSMLHLPDFRSAERSFQLLTQVAGRAGRHDKQGEVFVQTYTPDHYSVQDVKTHNFLSFYEKEMKMRQLAGYPPYYFLAVVHVSHADLNKAVEVTTNIASYLRRSLSDSAKIYGPSASPIPRIKDRYRYQCMIKYKIEPNLHHVLQELIESYQKEIMKTDLQLHVDTNPYMML